MTAKRLYGIWSWAIELRLRGQDHPLCAYGFPDRGAAIIFIEPYITALAEKGMLESCKVSGLMKPSRAAAWDRHDIWLVKNGKNAHLVEGDAK